MRRAGAALALGVLILIDIWVLSYWLPLVALLGWAEMDAWWGWLLFIGYTAWIVVPLYLTWLVARVLFRRGEGAGRGAPDPYEPGNV